MNSFTEDLLKENIVLNEKQVEDFRIFYSLLISENKITNLTRITEENDVYYRIERATNFLYRKDTLKPEVCKSVKSEDMKHFMETLNGTK